VAGQPLTRVRDGDLDNFLDCGGKGEARHAALEKTHYQQPARQRGCLGLSLSIEFIDSRFGRAWKTTEEFVSERQAAKRRRGNSPARQGGELSAI
jgi:hypothetical protein